MQPLLLTGQVARVAGVSEETVRQWTNKGWLATERTASGIRLYHPRVVHAFLADRNRQKVSVAPDAPPVDVALVGAR
jgi:DNA-binding transcriptional MerR regulator